MAFDNLFQYAISFTGSLNPALLATLFVINIIGEFAVSIPYLLEAIWLLTGYHVANGTLTPFEFLLIWLSAEAGRQTGATGLYFVGQLGSTPFVKFYRRLFPTSAPQYQPWQGFTPLRFLRRINYLSPLSVAIGRLLWLRIPLTLTLAIKKDLKTLLLAVLIQSALWDSIYLFIGYIGRTIVPRPSEMVLYSLVGLTTFYLLSLLRRRLMRRREDTQA